MTANEIIAIIGATSAGTAAVLAAVWKGVPALMKRNGRSSGYSIPPKDYLEVKAQTAENKINIGHLTDMCGKMAAMQEKQFDKIDDLGDKLDTTNGALMKLYGRVEQALRGK